MELIKLAYYEINFKGVILSIRMANIPISSQLSYANLLWTDI